MWKVNFLETLHDYLIQGIPEKEVIDIVLKYEEYISNAISEGLNEKDAVAILGSPKGIAEEFLSHHKSKSEGSPGIKISLINKLKLRFYKKIYMIRSVGTARDIIKFNRVFSTLLVIAFAIACVFLGIIDIFAVISIMKSITEVEYLLVSKLHFVSGMLHLTYTTWLLVFGCFIIVYVYRYFGIVYNFFKHGCALLIANTKYLNIKGKE